MSLYAVIGDPISHSKSPLIHSDFAAETGEHIKYVAHKVSSENFDDFVNEFFEKGGSGLNVTLPHKQRACIIAKHLDFVSKSAGAANTLYLNGDGEICAANTDGPGLIADIKLNKNTQIKGKDLLLLGAGGAIRGALISLIDEEPASITIANRTVSKAEALKQKFDKVLKIEACSYQNLGGDFDLIINGTSIGLIDDVPPLRASNLRKGSFCYDMYYSSGDTAFVRWAKANGAAHVSDGLGMLVEQAAESFFLWRGVRPNTKEIIKKLAG